MDIESKIFKAYDIRGIYPTQLNEDAAYAIGRAVATIFIEENPGVQLQLAVGGDMRLSTPSLKERLVAGLTDSGINVVDIGLVSTPTYYLAVAKNGYDGGVQVSASHNPGEYNGFKIVRSGGVAMSGETGIQKLLQIIQNESFAPMSEQKGTVTVRENVTEEAIEVYAEDEDLASIKPYKIVIDTANAMGALDYEALFKKIPATIEWMNKELDGTFPAHEADPLKPENTEDIRKKVVEVGADLGIAADGDSDRVFIIDEKGDTLPSPILYALLSKELLKDHPTATYAYEIRLGKIINDIFDGTQAKLVPTPVGHSLEKQLMLEHDAIFGGEISGHYFFKFSFGTFEAPSLLVMKLLTLLSTEGKPLSELAAPYKKYFSSGEINTKMESREDIDAKVNALKSTYADGNQVLIDGVKVEYPAWWFSVRASNTEPVIRLVVEADTQEMMEQKRDELLAFIRS